MIKKFISGIVLNGLALYFLTLIMEEITYTGGLTFFIVGALVIGVLNLIVKPILSMISLPFVIITGGLFLIVINGAILFCLSYVLGVAEFRDVTLTFPNYTSYAIGGLLFGLINWAERLILKSD